MIMEPIEVVEVPGLRVWQAPVVSVFGGAVELTAAGAGGNCENGQTWNPNAGQGGKCVGSIDNSHLNDSNYRL